MQSKYGSIKAGGKKAAELVHWEGKKAVATKSMAIIFYTPILVPEACSVTPFSIFKEILKAGYWDGVKQLDEPPWLVNLTVQDIPRTVSKPWAGTSQRILSSVLLAQEWAFTDQLCKFISLWVYFFLSRDTVLSGTIVTHRNQLSSSDIELQTLVVGINRNRKNLPISQRCKSI